MEAEPSYFDQAGVFTRMIPIDNTARISQIMSSHPVENDRVLPSMPSTSRRSLQKRPSRVSSKVQPPEGQAPGQRAAADNAKAGKSDVSRRRPLAAIKNDVIARRGNAPALGGEKATLAGR